MRVFYYVLVAVCLVACGPQVEGEYVSHKTALFASVNLILSVHDRKADLSMDKGDKPAKVIESFVAMEKDGRLILFKEDDKENQVIFTILDDGNKLQYETSAMPGLPKDWVRKAEI